MSPRMRQFAVFLAVKTSLVLVCGGSIAALTACAHGAEPIPAYLDPAEAGIEFQLQGEYRGWQRSRPSSRSSEAIGLQVMAQGDGKFTATKYYGGLPGQGWDGKQRFEYTGDIAGDLVSLQGADYTIEVDGNRALIRSLDGIDVGVLEKVHRQSPTLGVFPPPGAIVLFDGTKRTGFVEPKITEDNLLREGTQTAEAYGDFRMHAEFCLPFKPQGRGQDRGNSGFYIQGRYELQVLDSFGLEGIENECGALYKTRRPDTNMCLPPLSWQTYDVDFTMPRYDEQGNKTEPMRITVWHNGVMIHNRVAIQNKTGGGKKEGADPLPTLLQDHRNPVLYRNIWLLPKDGPGVTDSSWVKLPPSGPPIPIGVDFYQTPYTVDAVNVVIPGVAIP